MLHADVHDPMSGFSPGRPQIPSDETIYRASGVGFKILVDLLASTRRPVKPRRNSLHFPRARIWRKQARYRRGGSSIIATALLDKMVGDVIPLRFALYALVGALGVVLHLGTLGLLYVGGEVSFVASQTVATVVAMTFNFLLNNLITYRDTKLRGKRLLIGLFTFYAACSVGAAVNLTISGQLLNRGLPWLVAGFAGLAVSSVWNYTVTSVTTWRRKNWSRRHLAKL